MKFSDFEQLIDIARSDKERVKILERSLPRLRGRDLRAALTMLANLYALQRKFGRAAAIYDMVGMNEESVKARSRLS